MKSVIFSLFVLACIIAICLASDAGHGAHDTHAAADTHGDAHGADAHGAGHGDAHGDAHGSDPHGAAPGMTFGALVVVVPVVLTAVLSKQ